MLKMQRYRYIFRNRIRLRLLSSEVRINQFYGSLYFCLNNLISKENKINVPIKLHNRVSPKTIKISKDRDKDKAKKLRLNMHEGIIKP